MYGRWPPLLFWPCEVQPELTRKLDWLRGPNCWDGRPPELYPWPLQFCPWPLKFYPWPPRIEFPEPKERCLSPCDTVNAALEEELPFIARNINSYCHARCRRSQKGGIVASAIRVSTKLANWKPRPLKNQWLLSASSMIDQWQRIDDTNIWTCAHINQQLNRLYEEREALCATNACVQPTH